jgi:multidrug efflux system outer membrane protein
MKNILENQKRYYLLAVGIGSLISLGGCMVGPNYKRPNVPVPPQFKETASSVVPEDKTPAVGYSDWWRVFDDPVLDGLETQVASANLDIRAAVARFDQAEAGTKYARSFLFPTIGAGASVSRTREAQDRPNNGNTNGLAATYTDIPVALTLGYEVDVWGKIRRSLESARALQQASADDLRFVKLSMEASTAIDYYSLRENDAEAQVLQLTIQQLQQAVDLTTNRLKGGLASDLDVEEARTLVDQTKAQAQALDVQRAQLEHAIAVLVGRPASEFSIEKSPFDGTPPSIPSGLPADVLAQRPDIAEAERYLASASAKIGVAKAAYLPQISLTGLAGFESVSPASLFSWTNSIASLGASAVAPLFNGGRTRAGVEQAAAAYRESLAQYQKTVLTAYQEVEDQLAALRILQGEAQSETAAVDDSKKAEQVATNRYTRGLVSYLDVVYAQTALLANQRVLTQISGQRMVATCVLIKAIGGGWLGVPAQVASNPNPGAPGSISNATNQPALAKRVTK